MRKGVKKEYKTDMSVVPNLVNLFKCLYGTISVSSAVQCVHLLMLVCVCVCVCVYICMCVSVCVYVYIYVFVYICMYIYMCVC